MDGGAIRCQHILVSPITLNSNDVSCLIGFFEPGVQSLLVRPQMPSYVDRFDEGTRSRRRLLLAEADSAKHLFEGSNHLNFQKIFVT